MGSPRSDNRLLSLQACRFIAALLVLLYHMTVNTDRNFAAGVFRFGFVGVDFFFVLSGFIIATVNWRYIGHASAVPRYLGKRLLRIVPLYWAVTLVKLAAVLALPVYARAITPEYVIGALVLWPQRQPPLIDAAWTLTYELVFYAIFGALIATNGRVTVTALSAWALGSFTFWVQYVSRDGATHTLDTGVPYTTGPVVRAESVTRSSRSERGHYLANRRADDSFSHRHQ